MPNMLKRTVASLAVLVALQTSGYAQGVPVSNPQRIAELLELVRLSVIELGIEPCTSECANGEGGEESDQQIQKTLQTEKKP